MFWNAVIVELKTFEIIYLSGLFVLNVKKPLGLRFGMNWRNLSMNKWHIIQFVSQFGLAGLGLTLAFIDFSKWGGLGAFLFWFSFLPGIYFGFRASEGETP